MIKFDGHPVLFEPSAVAEHANTDWEAGAPIVETWEDAVIVAGKAVAEWDRRIKACLEARPFDDVRLRQMVDNRDRMRKLLFQLEHRL